MRLQRRVYRPRLVPCPLRRKGRRPLGGRCNPIGVAALATAWRRATAWRAAPQGFAFKPQALTISADEVDGADVADLTDPRTRADVAVESADLAGAWGDRAARGREPPSWALARRRIAAGTAALVVPSCAPDATEDDRNLVFWRGSETLPHRVVVIHDAGRRPQAPRSWS